MLNFKTAALAAVSTLALTLGAAAQDKLELKYTVPSVPTDLHTQAMKVFADKLEELVPGRFDIQLYDSGSLFAQGADLGHVMLQLFAVLGRKLRQHISYPGGERPVGLGHEEARQQEQPDPDPDELPPPSHHPLAELPVLPVR